LSASGRLYHLYDPTLFLQQGVVPVQTTYLRDPFFLRFFQRRLRRTPTSMAAPPPGVAAAAAAEHPSRSIFLDHVARRFPYVSTCGPEANFLAVQAGCYNAACVFEELERHDATTGGGSVSSNDSTTGNTAPGKGMHRPSALLLPGPIRVPFDATSLREHDGRLFYPTRPSLRRTCLVAASPLAAFERRQRDGATDDDDDEDDDGQAKAATSGSKLYSSECCDVDALDAWLRQDMVVAATSQPSATVETCGGPTGRADVSVRAAEL
jgi:hypothetical protein